VTVDTAEATKARRATLVVNLGDAEYVVQRPWGDLPTYRGTVSDVTTDARGHVFVLLRKDSLVDNSGPAVVELSKEGRLLAAWGGDAIADGHMFAVSPDGRIFVVDRDAHQVVIFDKDGKQLGSLGQRGKPLTPFNHPCGVAFSPAGDIYVCDGYAASRIHRFSPAGELINSWGERGAGPGQFSCPHGIWVLTDCRVAVADRENHRVQIFSPDGTLIEIWTGFYRPTDIWADAANNVYVADQVPSLTLFSNKGVLLGRCRPVLNSAHGIWGDAATGDILLAEANPSRITRLRLAPKT